MDAFAAHLASGEIKLQAEGFLISVCTEQEIDSVENLTRQEKNSLKMAVRQRQPGVISHLNLAEGTILFILLFNKLFIVSSNLCHSSVGFLDHWMKILMWLFRFGI